MVSAFCLKKHDFTTISSHLHQFEFCFQVNDLAFHPIHGTLATVGSDGRYAFWDKDARTKIRGLDNPEMQLTCCAFDPKGALFAYASGYDWSKGHESADPSKPPKIFLRQSIDEMKPGQKP